MGRRCSPWGWGEGGVKSSSHIVLSIFSYSFILKIYLFIYLFLAVLGLHCCTWAFSSCSEPGLYFIAVLGLLIAVASLVAEHWL